MAYWVVKGSDSTRLTVKGHLLKAKRVRVEKVERRKKVKLCLGRLLDSGGRAGAWVSEKVILSSRWKSASPSD